MRCEAIFSDRILALDKAKAADKPNGLSRILTQYSAKFGTQNRVRIILPWLPRFDRGNSAVFSFAEKNLKNFQNFPTVFRFALSILVKGQENRTFQNKKGREKL